MLTSVLLLLAKGRDICMLSVSVLHNTNLKDLGKKDIVLTLIKKMKFQSIDSMIV